MDINEKFDFNISIKFDENTYISIYRTKIDKETPKYSMKFYIRLIIALCIVGLSFLSIYTTIIGIAIILFYLYVLLEQKILILVEKYKFKNRKYLQEEIEYSLNSEEVRLKSKTLDVKTTWDSLYNWHKRGNWLIMTFYDTPTVHLPIDKMMEAKVYDIIFELAKKYGKEYK